MDIINTNRLRVSVRLFRPLYGERFTNFSFGSYRSSDHGKPRLERNYFGRVLGVIADVKYRPDGKRAALRR
jgi:hypothetical protein